jgi:hypothetical protein
MTDGKLAHTDKDKADTLNTFFASVISKENLENNPTTEVGSRSNAILLSDVIVTPIAVQQKLINL